MKPSKFLKFAKIINFYPPYIGAGIRLVEVNPEGNRFVVEMKLRWYNRNINGTHFGGSLYSMCDPFYVFAAHSMFQDDYILWDKSASINYVRPGFGKVRAVFEIPQERLKIMKEEVDNNINKLFTFQTDITDMNGKVVAKVEKTIYIKRKHK